jgi:hypothetical protein
VYSGFVDDFDADDARYAHVTVADWPRIPERTGSMVEAPAASNLPLMLTVASVRPTMYDLALEPKVVVSAVSMLRERETSSQNAEISTGLPAALSMLKNEDLPCRNAMRVSPYLRLKATVVVADPDEPATV